MLVQLLSMQWILAFIDGMPGIGKTTLAKSLLKSLKAAFPTADAIQLIAVRGIVASQAGGRTMAFTFDTMSWERGRGRTAAYADAESRAARLQILVIDEYEELSQEKLQVSVTQYLGFHLLSAFLLKWR
jgi:nucleoside-triphosphatase THEP1